MKSTHPLASPSAWSEAVYFTPFVGDDYELGLDGARVLLLGESHYGGVSRKPGDGPDCTQYNFGDYTSDDCDIDVPPQFFRKLPRILARDENVTQLESAAAWRRIAYANFVQEFVGGHARMRPNHDQWKRGQAALTEFAEKLRPDVVLVLGAQLWNHITEGRPSKEANIIAERCDREVWLIPHDHGFARASWIYHPSTNYESLSSAMGVFAELMRRAADVKALPASPSAPTPERTKGTNKGTEVIERHIPTPEKRGQVHLTGCSQQRVWR
jgi:hypothetical protein